jgi:hypothetical protein
MFCLHSSVSLSVQIYYHAKGNNGYTKIHSLVPCPCDAHPFNQPEVIITAITTPTASRTTAAASTSAPATATASGPPTGTRRYTIPVIAEVGCADSEVLLETASLRNPVFAIISTATVECEDLSWKRSHKRPKFYLSLIIQLIPHHFK